MGSQFMDRRVKKITCEVLHFTRQLDPYANVLYFVFVQIVGNDIFSFKKMCVKSKYQLLFDPFIIVVFMF